SRELEHARDVMKRTSNWLHKVYEIMDLARSNRIAAAELPAMAQRSVSELLELLPEPTSDELDARLERELTRAIASMAESIAGGDRTKGAARVLGELKKIQRAMHDGRLPWEAWPRLAAVSPGKKSQGCVEALQTVALRYQEHPRFQDDLCRFIQGAYNTAQRA